MKGHVADEHTEGAARIHGSMNRVVHTIQSFRWNAVPCFGGWIVTFICMNERCLARGRALRGRPRQHDGCEALLQPRRPRSGSFWKCGGGPVPPAKSQPIVGAEGGLWRRSMRWRLQRHTECLSFLCCFRQRDSLRLQHATACVPPIYSSTAHIVAVRNDFISSLESLLSSSSSSSSPLFIPFPLTSIGSGALGYYIIYQGLPDRPPRRLLARVYWRASPSLPFTSPHLAALPDDGVLPPLPSLGRRVRVGFMSEFFFHHSVGLLMEGVITGLDREKYDVTIITPAMEVRDEVTERILAAADSVLEIPCVPSVRCFGLW